MTAISLTAVTTIGAVVALALLTAAVGAVALGLAALRTVRGLHRRLDALTGGLREETAGIPAARDASRSEEIRGAVAEALAEERERELAEARAFWAAQEAREAGNGGPDTLAGHGIEYEVAPGLPSDLEAAVLDDLLDGAYEPYEPPTGEIFIPRQSAGGREDTPRTGDETAGNPDLTSARRRHPSNPDFDLRGEPRDPDPESPAAPAAAPAVADSERTMERLGELAEQEIPLADVRQGPLGTLDVYVFEDDTTVCLSPGHPETAGALCEALRKGDRPLLVGGSGISGAYTLTFTYGEGRIAYLLADRVIASL